MRAAAADAGRADRRAGGGVGGAARRRRAAARQLLSPAAGRSGYRADGVLSAQIFGNFSRYPNINALAPVSAASRAAEGAARRGLRGDHQRRAAGRRRTGHDAVRDRGPRRTDDPERARRPMSRRQPAVLRHARHPARRAAACSPTISTPRDAARRRHQQGDDALLGTARDPIGTRISIEQRRRRGSPSSASSATCGSSASAATRRRRSTCR